MIMRLRAGSLVCLLLMCSSMLWGQTTDLFFSEYVEGSSFNKAIEIYNGTGTAVDLSQYSIELYSNGSTAISKSIVLSGMLANGDVYVAAHGSADAAILAVADMTNSTVINFNGDDAFALRKEDALVDVIGKIGEAIEWGEGNTASTKDNTIRRKENICSGDGNGSDAFDPSAEWDGYAKDSFDGLGFHSSNCSDGPTTTSIYDIQYTTDSRGDSPLKDQRVTTQGVVTAVFSNGYFIQDAAGGAWTGVFVYDSSNTPVIGDLIQLDATVAEYNNLTELTNITNFQTVSSGNALPAAQPLESGSVADEQWEGCLVKVNDVTITNTNLGYNEWSVDDGSGDVRIDDKGSYAYTPVLDAELSSITGPLDYSYSNFKIQPRDDNDILDKPPVNLVITGVIDGPLPDGKPKAIELCAIADIADLSLYGIGIANNGDGSDGQEFTFPMASVTAGSFIYLASETVDFTAFFGFAPTYTSSKVELNGDDAVELFLDGKVVDVFGDIDGPNTDWNYLDGWAYRQKFTGPDGSTFVMTSWSFSGINALDGETTNAAAETPFPIGAYVNPSQKPEITTSESAYDFGYHAVGEESDSWSYTVSSVNVASTITVTSNDGTHFSLSNDDVTFAASTTVPATGGTIYVRFTSSGMTSYTSTVTHSATGTDDVDVTVEGNSDYYATTIGKTGDALKAELHNIIKGHTVYSYSDVWDAMRQTDADPANPENVILIYTGRSQDADYKDGGSGIDYESLYGGTYDNAYNREHVWAKSHGFPDESDVAYTDIHHLRPCDRTVNSTRNEHDFDWGTTWHSEATECKTATNIWEPRDAVKGDVARMMFYMATRYEADDGYDLELVDYAGTEPGDELFGNLNTLIEWHNSDPVDEWERNRNTIIDKFWQHNRNPFIDHPEFVAQIWSDPIYVDLSSFAAYWVDDVVNIQWTATCTKDCAGFNVYRRDNEQTDFEKINETLIETTGDSNDYLFVDTAGEMNHEYRLEFVSLDGNSTFFGPITVSDATGVDESLIPNDFALHQNYPNPFNPTTAVRFDLPKDSHVSIQIYDLQGRLVKNLVDDMKPAGAHSIIWNATNNQSVHVSSGLYYIKMDAGDYHNVKRLTFLK